MHIISKTQLFIIVGLLFMLCPLISEETSSLLSSNKLELIETHIENDLSNWQIPGLSVAIITERDIIYRNYGFSNQNKKEITEDTLYEIASNSKAFTGLGILLLEKQGKISLQDSISEYIPWLKFVYNNEEAIIKIEDFMYHKSGVPFSTIADIPSDIEDGAIERAVRNLVNIDLDFEPGSHFSYTTINYDVLGLLIEIVTKTNYEKYIKENILSPLELNNTYSNFEEATSTGLVSHGYKINLLHPRPYKAPFYRGNVPAGYFFSSSKDISRWLQIQMGIIDVQSPFNEIIKKSQNADLTFVDPYDNTSYSTGWFYYPDQKGLYSHSGSNPNYSSFFAFNPHKKIGIVVLANINSDITDHIGVGIADILFNTEMLFPPMDMYTSIDKISLGIIIISIILLISLFILISQLMKSIKDKRRKIIERKRIYIKITITAVFSILLGYFFYQVPAIAFDGVDWIFLNIWGSALLLPAFILLYVTLLLVLGFFVALRSFKKS